VQNLVLVFRSPLYRTTPLLQFGIGPFVVTFRKTLDADDDDDTVQFVSWFIAVRLFPVMAAASGFHRGKPNDWLYIRAGTVMTTVRAHGERFRVLSLGEKVLWVAFENGASMHDPAFSKTKMRGLVAMVCV
jgi:hypothetical protein